ncbi:MAG TPA: DUF1203 domain-containing protein [Chitinophagaceae bacterium]|nr:DUF1203 domain-containing protein [Chitinophagaceae bacterium]
MCAFRIVPLSRAYANRIRRERVDAFGHAVMEQLATGHGPCRVSLRPFRPGQDRRLLFSHSPFAVDNAFNQPGPVFIFSDDVEEYRDVHRFPPQIKADRDHFPLTLIGYDRDQQMVHTQLVGDADVEDLIEELFAGRDDIAYLHARSAEACCYICRIERA